jgi:UDP-glucuronate 4-epimerase
LIIDGHTVTAIDCLTGNYDPAQKRSNVHALSTLHGCRIVQADLRWCALEPLLEGVDVVFHQAGQPGV